VPHRARQRVAPAAHAADGKDGRQRLDEFDGRREKGRQNGRTDIGPAEIAQHSQIAMRRNITSY
jgi:hypothetical protein